MANSFKFFKDTQVASVDDEKPVRLVIKGLTGEEIWLNNIKGGVSPNFQLMYSVGTGAFINAFNQRLSMWEITGTYVPNTCDNNQPSGEPSFVTFYDQNNIVNSTDPTMISFNGIVLSGFMVALNVMDYSKDGIDGHGFVLQFLGKMNNLTEKPATSTSTPAEAATTDVSQNPNSNTASATNTKAGQEAGSTSGAPKSSKPGEKSSGFTPEQRAEFNAAEAAGKVRYPGYTGVPLPKAPGVKKPAPFQRVVPRKPLPLAPSVKKPV